MFRFYWCRNTDVSKGWLLSEDVGEKATKNPACILRNQLRQLAGQHIKMQRLFLVQNFRIQGTLKAINLLIICIQSEEVTKFRYYHKCNSVVQYCTNKVLRLSSLLSRSLLECQVVIKGIRLQRLYLRLTCLSYTDFLKMEISEYV